MGEQMECSLLPKCEEAKKIAEKLQLQMHPSCIGWFREMYRSSGQVVRQADQSQRSFTTGIYFLQESSAKAAWRKLKSDETFVYQKGASIKVFTLNNESKSFNQILLGDIVDDKNAESFHFTVPANTWFNTKVNQNGYTLMSVFVSPGYDYSDYEEGDPIQLAKLFENAAELILSFQK